MLFLVYDDIVKENKTSYGKPHLQMHNKVYYVLILLDITLLNRI